MAFGTGAVKITPAHDPNDYGCGKRHNLEFINILTPQGAINDNGAPFTGMMRCVASWGRGCGVCGVHDISLARSLNLTPRPITNHRLNLT